MPSFAKVFSVTALALATFASATPLSNNANGGRVARADVADARQILTELQSNINACTADLNAGSNAATLTSSEAKVQLECLKTNIQAAQAKFDTSSIVSTVLGVALGLVDKATALVNGLTGVLVSDVINDVVTVVLGMVRSVTGILGLGL